MSLLLRPANRQAGATLAEMVTVVAVLAVAASLAIPRADPQAGFAADAMAGEVAGAIRFAQREAVRTRKYYVAEIDPATQAIRVYRLTDAPTVAEDPVPVMHPVDKQAYRINLASNAAARAVISSAVFIYGSAVSDEVAFDENGTPVAVNYLKGITPTAALSIDGSVTVRSGGAQHTITVDKNTGRVTL